MTLQCVHKGSLLHYKAKQKTSQLTMGGPYHSIGALHCTFVSPVTLHGWKITLQESRLISKDTVHECSYYRGSLLILTALYSVFKSLFRIVNLFGLKNSVNIL